MKECVKCGEAKSLSGFYKHATTADGYRTVCKECTGKASKAQRDADPAIVERLSAARRERFSTHPEAYERHKRQSAEGYHRLVYGHTRFLNDPLLNNKDRYARAKAMGYRSGLEVKIAEELKAKGVEFGYETIKIPFTPPLKERTYTPDIILPNGIIVELKGRFVTEDRQKQKHIKAQHPDLDIRFVFSNANAKLSKASPTTYGMWATQYGFPFSQKSIPQNWLDEPLETTRMDALLRVARPTRQPNK